MISNRYRWLFYRALTYSAAVSHSETTRDKYSRIMSFGFPCMAKATFNYSTDRMI